MYEVRTLAERACADLGEQHLRLSNDGIAWSPDSTRIAFTEDAFVLFVDSDLWVMDATSGELTSLTDDGFEGSAPILGDGSEQPDGPINLDVLSAWAPDAASRRTARCAPPYARTDE